MANAEWMLTPAEREKLWEEYFNKGLYQQMDWDEVLIKAEAKKMLDKMEIELGKVTYATAKEITGSLWWQSLHKEVLGE